MVARRRCGLTIVGGDRERSACPRRGKEEIVRPRRLIGCFWAAPQLHRYTARARLRGVFARYAPQRVRKTDAQLKSRSL